MSLVVAHIGTTKSEMDFLDEFLCLFFHVPEAQTLQEKVKIVKSQTFNGKYTVESLVDEICTLSGVTLDQVKSRKKKRKLTDVRAIISNLTYEMFPTLTLNEIGDLTGRNHSTVLHHFEMVNRILELKREYSRIKKQIAINKS